ncbi:OprD family outer membrane porin [Pseudomonas gessardii]|uniref:OprD family outer membrane porin n=1 Tax=Pseudomonas gessardii TaxID=78544 RepID=UPI001475628A|nr:OprD family outer membrane porin [Pseudomonas gessardii]NNA65320.1 OprD family porin [Pseudomonas gessardii]
MKKVYVFVSFGFLLGFAGSGSAEENSEKTEGFLEQSTLDLLLRNMYFNRDVKNGGLDPRGWGQSFRLDYTSGFTQGLVGLGIDASAYSVLKLDGGPRGSGLFPLDGDKPRDESSSAGAAVKVRVSKTVLKYGDLRPDAPIFAMPDSRLVPITTRGWHIASDEIDNVSLDAGYFTSSKGYVSTRHDGGFSAGYAGVEGGNVSYVGLKYRYDKNTKLMVYASRVEDIWRQYYANANHNVQINSKEQLNFDFNIYRTLNEGASLAGPINVTAWSLASTYTYDTHKITLAYQKISGNQPFDYLKTSDGGYTNGIYLANSSQYGDFNSPNEQSWGLTYNYDMRGLGIPGLSVGARYVYGYDIDGKHLDANGRYGYLANASTQSEKDFRAKYVVQAGQFKDLSMQVRYAMHRFSGDGAPNLNEVRIITEYPINIF